MNQTNDGIENKGTRSYNGGCHCGAVRFRVTIEENAPASRCNCSICTKLGATGSLVKPDAFQLIRGADSLSGYQWGAKISTRFFCKTCGVFCFGRGHLAEVGGDFVSVNMNTFEELELRDLQVIYWDGRHDNWGAGPRSTPWPIHADEAAQSAA